MKILLRNLLRLCSCVFATLALQPLLAQANQGLACGVPDRSMDEHYVIAVNLLRSSVVAYDQPLMQATINTLSCLQAAVEQGDAESTALLGMLTHQGAGVRKNAKQGKALLKAAIERGSVFARYGLAVVLINFEKSKRRNKEGAAMMEEAAALGHPYAIAAAARMYDSGELLPRDPKRAQEFAAKAATLGVTDAHVHLGLMHLGGDNGLPKNAKTAYQHFRSALRLGETRGYELMLEAIIPWLDEEFDYAYDSATPLTGPVIDGREDIVIALLDTGEDPNWLAENDVTPPLRFAIEQRSPTLVGRLLDAGADPNIVDGKGWSALAVANYEGANDIVQLLLNAGANVDGSGGDSELTPLYSAIYGKHTALAVKLLDAGADPNKPSFEQQRPLHIAAYHGLTELVDLLLEQCADPALTDAKGVTAQQLARRRGWVLLANAMLGAKLAPSCKP